MPTKQEWLDNLLRASRLALEEVSSAWEMWPTMTHEERVDYLFSHVDDAYRYLSRLRDAKEAGELSAEQKTRLVELETLWRHVKPIVDEMEASFDEQAATAQ